MIGQVYISEESESYFYLWISATGQIVVTLHERAITLLEWEQMHLFRFCGDNTAVAKAFGEFLSENFERLDMQWHKV